MMPLPQYTKTTLRLEKIFRDPISGLTHFIGAIASILGLFYLMRYAFAIDSLRHIIALGIFGISLILLYTASTVYHLANCSENIIMILRRIDHMMIYVLIAGTYTPICMLALEGRWGTGLLISIWTLAFVGIILKLVWFEAPRWLSTLFYILMGWLVVVAFVPLIKAVPWAGIAWLVLGGLFYTVGAAIYAAKWPRLTWQLFGFHEIFHLFVMAGSFCHFWLVYEFIM